MYSRTSEKRETQANHKSTHVQGKELGIVSDTPHPPRAVVKRQCSDHL